MRNDGGKKVIFATHAWERDYDVVLSPVRFQMVMESLCHSFSDVVIVLNNFKNGKSRLKAHRAAEKLKKMGLATQIFDAADYLTDEVLSGFGLTPAVYWENNPYFSSAQLAALHYAKGKADFLLHLCGDVWLYKKGAFIERAVEQFGPVIAGMNLCRNIYMDKYPLWCHGEDENLWISNKISLPGGPENGRGFGLSDHAYLIRTDIPYKFTDFSMEGYADLLPRWPAYASPCFEMYFSKFLFREGYCYAALKPVDSVPITKHKKIKTRFRNFLYRSLGYYQPNGKYGTKV